MATFTLKSSKGKFMTNSEFRSFPVTFVNGLRRVILSDLPTVVIRNIQIMENTTQMPHEMLKHRMELLPVNAHHTDTAIIREATIELRIMQQPQDSTITTDDFVVQSGREHLLMKDRDLGTPLLFLRMRKGEQVHMKGQLAVEKGSQVCTATMSYHVDPEIAELHKKKYVEDGGDPRVFDNFYIQKSYSRDEQGRPNWIDMSVESVGVLTSKEIMKLGVSEFKQQIDDWTAKALNSITNEKEENVYHVRLQQGGHTVGAVLQELIYHSEDVSFVSYDIPHDMKNDMVIRFLTTKSPELILKNAQKKFHEYCDIVDKSI